MATMNISITDSMQDWVQTTVATGDYQSNSDYIRDLIRKDMQRANKLHMLQRALDEGLSSDKAGPLCMEDIKAKARKELNNAPSHKDESC